MLFGAHSVHEAHVLMRKSLLVVAVLAIAGCGGGGGAVTPVATAIATAAPTTAPTSTPTTTSVQSAKLTLTFATSKGSSAKGRTPQFVDGANSASLVTIINSYNGSTTLPSWLSAYASVTTALTTTGTSPNCSVSGGIETCVVTVAAPPGSVNYTFNVLDASSRVLSTSTVTETLAQGSNNTISNVTLRGVVASASFNAPALAANAPQSDVGVSLTVADAAGGAITGAATPYSGSTVTVTSNNAHFLLSVNGGAYGSSVVVTSPGDALNLRFKYDGQALPAGAITLSATQTTGGGSLGGATFSTSNNTPTFTGLTIADTAHGASSTDPNYNQPTEFFATTGQTQSLVKTSELGFTNSPYSLNLTATTGAGCTNIISALSIGAPDAGGNQTITATSGTSAGICQITVSDGIGDSASFYASVTAGTFNVN